MIVRNFTGSKGQSIGASILVTGIPQTGSTVTATKGSKTVNGVWGATIQNPEWRGLPIGYTQVKSLIGDGNAYINTGVALSFPLSASIKFKFNALNSSADVLCGSEQTNKANTIFGSNPSFKFYTQFQYDYPRFTIGRDTTTTHYATTNANATTIQTTLDDTTLSVTTTNVLSSLPVYLFAYNNQGTAQYISQADIELFTLTLNNTLTCDYVPCKNSSNEYGMYDMVTGTFFGNSGTGSFTGGEEVPQFISAEGYLITPLTEYGEWTVTATDGTHSASQTVTVDMLMMYEIEMSYILKLYWLGDECTDVTGGWSAGQFIDAYGGGTATRNADNLRAYTPSLTSIGWYTTNQIDLTNVNTVVFNVSECNRAYAVRLCGASTSTRTGQTGVVILDISATGQHALDVSSLSGTYYIGFGCWAYGSSVAVNKVWLE